MNQNACIKHNALVPLVKQIQGAPKTANWERNQTQFVATLHVIINSGSMQQFIELGGLSALSELMTTESQTLKNSTLRFISSLFSHNSKHLNFFHIFFMLDFRFFGSTIKY